MGEFHIDPKVKKYESFLNDKLKMDLKITHEERDKLYKQIAEYMQLKQVIGAIKIEQKSENNSKKNSLRTKIDLGCNFYCQAVVPDCSMLYILVGYGYYVEMTLDEAGDFVEKKIKILTEKSQMFHKDSAKIKAHIRLVMEALREIQHIQYIDRSQNRVF